jgi:hypothetical protein
VPSHWGVDASNKPRFRRRNQPQQDAREIRRLVEEQNSLCSICNQELGAAEASQMGGKAVHGYHVSEIQNKRSRLESYRLQSNSV